MRTYEVTVGAEFDPGEPKFTPEPGVVRDQGGFHNGIDPGNGNALVMNVPR